MNAIDRAIEGAANAPITREMKTELILLARRAFKRGQELGTIPETLAFDDWRHREQTLATERSSLTQATNEDFRFLKAHFLALAGADRQAERTRSGAEREGWRVARHKLASECDKAADVIERPEAYALSIARARWKTDDAQRLTAKQLWVLVFDLRRNAQRRRKKAGVT
jgi:hypothetical protein